MTEKRKALRSRRYWVWPQHLRAGDMILCEKTRVFPGLIPVLVTPLHRRAASRGTRASRR